MATDTILVPGNGTGTLSVQLHGPDVTDVEAVLAEIDTGGAGDTIATLTATSPTGLDVAAVPQGSPVSGGGQGRATWALRLAEDGGAGTAKAVYAYGHFAGTTNPPDFNLPIVTQGLAGVAIGIGGQWVIGKAGLYVVTLDAYIGLSGGNPANSEAALFLYNFTHPPEIVRLSLVTAVPIPIGTAAQVRAASTRLVPLAAGDTLGLQLSENVFATKASTDDGHVGLYRIA